MMYYKVVPFFRSFDSWGLTYKVPTNLVDSIQVGMIVLVPFGENQLLGVTLAEVSGDSLEIDVKEIKEISEFYSDIVFLSPEQCQMIDFIAERYFCHIHHCLQLFFPKNLLEKITKQTVTKIKLKQYDYINTQISLNTSQEKIYHAITSEEKNNKFLLFGVTGSGKTQIYMKLIEENLKKGKQSLLLIPEIILTSQIGQRIQKEFGEDVIILHSGISAAKKAEYWMNIHEGNIKIVVGTRSALFYPYNNLGLIIIDEEHDESYISDNVPRYHTRDVAEKLSELYNVPLILGSGTPKVTTFYKGLSGEYTLLQLLEKYK